jgi:hypothetical protein
MRTIFNLSTMLDLLVIIAPASVAFNSIERIRRQRIESNEKPEFPGIYTPRIEFLRTKPVYQYQVESSPTTAGCDLCAVLDGRARDRYAGSLGGGETHEEANEDDQLFRSDGRTGKETRG